VEQCFSLTANQPQPAYKPKNSLPNRALPNLSLRRRKNEKVKARKRKESRTSQEPP
jgi:hypothetical protein